MSDIAYLNDRIAGLSKLIENRCNKIKEMEATTDISKIGGMLALKEKNYAIVTDYYSFEQDLEKIYKTKKSIDFEKEYVKMLGGQLERVKALKLKKEVSLQFLNRQNAQSAKNQHREDSTKQSKTPTVSRAKKEK